MLRLPRSSSSASTKTRTPHSLISNGTATTSSRISLCTLHELRTRRFSLCQRSFQREKRDRAFNMLDPRPYFSRLSFRRAQFRSKLSNSIFNFLSLHHLMPYVWKTEVVEVEQEVSSLDFLGFLIFLKNLEMTSQLLLGVKILRLPNLEIGWFWCFKKTKR